MRTVIPPSRAIRVVFVLSTLLLGCATFAAGPAVEVKRRADKASDPYELPPSVSFVALLANPERYEGKVLTVSGVLSVEFEDTSLYRDSETYEFNRASDAVFLHLTDELLMRTRGWQGQHVVVTGRFQREKAWASFHGRLHDIERIDRLLGRDRRPGTPQP